MSKTESVCTSSLQFSLSEFAMARQPFFNLTANPVVLSAPPSAVMEHLPNNRLVGQQINIPLRPMSRRKRTFVWTDSDEPHDGGCGRAQMHYAGRFHWA